MSEPKFTKGPWRAEEWSCHAATTVLVDDKSVVTGKRIVAECETEDDARLIAAAPDLFEACSALVEGMEASGITGIYLDQARAAIAKALGEPR